MSESTGEPKDEPIAEVRRDLQFRHAALRRRNRTLQQWVDAAIQREPTKKIGRPAGEPQVRSSGSRRRSPALYLDVRHGLSNRLQALGSGLALAACLQRRFVLLWRPSAHCDCRYEDLFEPASFEVLEALTDLPETFEELDVYNSMEFEGGRKLEPLLPRPKRSLLVRSAYPLRHPRAKQDALISKLRGLQPVPDVDQMVREVDVRGVVGVHVRMAVAGAVPPPWEQWQGNWSLRDHDVIDAWRRKCGYERFFEPMRALVEERPGTRFFVAADSIEAVEGLRAEFGDRILTRPVAQRDRSREALRDALADLLLLSRTRLILGSGYSSFSRIASWIGGIEMRLAGVDF